MDLMRIMQSLEEFLYEVMTWLLFYPRTMWRAVVHPLTMLRYSDKEQHDDADHQYTDAMSPPLFLLLTVVLAHFVELAAHQHGLEARSAFSQELMNSEVSLLVLRAMLFAVYPLMFAAARLRREHKPVTRETLRGPFYAQCYVAAPAAFVMGVGAILARSTNLWLAGAAILVTIAAAAWYISVETAWLREKTGMAKFPAARSAFGTWFKASLVSSLLSMAIVGIQG